MTEMGQQRGVKLLGIAFLSVLLMAGLLSGCGAASFQSINGSTVEQGKKTLPSVQWATPAPVTYGTSLSATQLNATSPIAGSFTYSPAYGIVPAAGKNKLTVVFTPQDATHYMPETLTVSLTVNKAVPTLVWATPAAITYGTRLSAAQLNASSAVWGSFSYSPASGTLPEAGNETLTAKFIPEDTTDFTTVTRTVTLTVNKVTPTLAWATPAAIVAGTALSATQLDATSSVPGRFTYSPAAKTVPAAGTDTLSVTFTPTDTKDYNAASASVVLDVANKTTPTITWVTPAAITAGTALSATQLDATASVPGRFTYSPAAKTVPAAGTDTLTVTFTPTDTTHYNSASASVTLNVNKITPTITWPTPAAIVSGTKLSATQLDATASVAGSFVYSPAAGSTPAVGTDTLSVTFTPSDTKVYNTTSASVALLVNKITKTTPTITWPTPASIIAGTALSAAQLNATASVPGSFVYSPAAGSTPAAGTDTLSVTFTPTDTTDYNSASASVTLDVNKITPTITWPIPASIVSGTKLSATQLDATASVAGSFVYSPASGSMPAVGTDALSVTFTPQNTADYASVTASVNLVVTSATTPPPNSSVTNIDVGSTVIQAGMKRLGINIDSQDYFDSGQMLRNLTFRNPGFEGETWQSILQCVAVTANTCTDTNAWTQWPANFLKGATFEFIYSYGAALGQTGTIVSSTVANPSANTGVTVQFSSMGAAPAVGDFVVVRMNIPGNAQAGWWTNTYGGGTLTTELADLSPNTIGKQALRMTAAGAGQSAAIDSYFDSTNTHNFVLLNGSYQITFRAKGVGGNNQLNVALGREISNGSYFSQTVTLTPAWQDYTLTFSASETPSTAVGTVDLHFEADGASVLLDDVSLTPVSVSSVNPTVFRDEVVSTLVALHPGSLRYMDGLPDFGSSIDNMLTPAFGRQRAGSSTQQTEQDDIAIGLHEFLQLCQTVGAEPWYNLPPAITPTEMQNLIEYLGGDASTTYGAKRAALGQAAPWTSVFPVIHLELGNEQWNYATFPGNAIDDPIAYGKRAATVFGAARSSASYVPASFDLIMGSFALNSWYTGQEIANSSNYDSISVAPYLFGSLNDTSSNEAIFGPMFAEPEMWDSTPNGLMVLQSQAITAAGKKLVSYEENIGTQTGTASQSMVNAVVPSVSGGVAMAVHMLLQMRDLGIKTQNVWALPEFNNQFNNPNDGSETTPIYGTVIDMGGQTNRRRPVFLGEQLVNTAILPSMLGTTVSGANPTWNQPLSTNDSVQLNGAHELQSFAFTDGNNQRSVVVVNLSRSAALPVTFTGANAPTGTVAVNQLTSANLTDTNENEDDVVLTSPSGFQPGAPYSLPPFSVTVFTWQTPP